MDTFALALVLAQAEEAGACYEIIRDGRAFQKEQGFSQWTDDYPNRETIEKDIENGTGYVVKTGDRIAAYMCIDFAGEPAYDQIQGKWHTGEPYAVVHRMAFDRKFRGIGLTGRVFPLIERLCLEKQVTSIRVDTDFPNQRMQHILEKYGFQKCGTIYFQGGEKIAYDKILSRPGDA